MDKIKDLLKQLGASEELSKNIVSEMLSWRKREQAKLNEQFQARLEKAKQICLEEFDTEKSRLSRKVEVFLEAHVNKIDREAQRQAAIGESESVKTLRDVKCLLEGVPVDGAAKELQAVKDNEKRLHVRLNQAIKESAAKDAEARRANVIAMKALQRNKILEGKLGDGKTTVAESKEKETSKPAKEALRDLRQESETPKTTRRVLTESQVPAKKTDMQSGDPDIMRIASEVDETPAFLNH